MNYRLEITIPAEQDINRAFAWYENQSPGLGDEFLDELADALETIRTMPSLFAADRHGTRIGPIHRFPYFIVYLEDPDAGAVFVFSVTHGHRHPAAFRP